MELLLNVVWLLLAVPAVWIWRHESVCRHETGGFRSLCRPLILGWALMLLFPVVSATDDLHAMRPELEESSTSKRVVKLAVPSRSPIRLSSGSVAANFVPSADFHLTDQTSGIVFVPLFSLPHNPARGIVNGRAPPVIAL